MTKQGTTTVKADEDKIEQVKHMGHGMLSKAFRAGLDMLLDCASIEEHELKIQRDMLKNERSEIDVKIEHIESKLSEIELRPAGNVSSANESIIQEFMRCSPSIVYEHKTQLIDHLASLCHTLTPDKVRAFYKDRKREPTRDDIEHFLR